MFGFMTRWGIRSAEKDLGVPLDYLLHMHEKAPAAFRQYSRLMPVAAYRDKLPAAPFHVARLVATRHEGCGTCVQLVVNMAKRDGIDPDTLRLALAGNADALPEQLRDVYRFAEAVVAADGGEDEYRERLRQVFGEEALVELALAIATARALPTLKRALGYTTSGSPVRVEV